MRAGSLAEGDALAFEIRQRLDRRVPRNNDRLRIAIRLDGGDVSNSGASRLRENRRSIADIAEVDATGVDCLKQRRSDLKIDPLDLDAKRLECIFDRMALPYRRKEAALLRADAYFGRLVLGLRRR